MLRTSGGGSRFRTPQILGLGIVPLTRVLIKGCGRLGRPELFGIPGRARPKPIGGVRRHPGPRPKVRLAVPYELIERLLAHELNQFRSVGDVDRVHANVRFSIARAVPVEVVAARTVYVVPSGRSTVRNVRRSGSCQQTSGLVSNGCRPWRSAYVCSAHPAPAGKPGRLRKMHAPSWTRVLGDPSSSLSSHPLRRASDRNCQSSSVSRLA